MHGMMTSLNSFSMRCMLVLTLPTTKQNRPVGEDLGSAVCVWGGGGGGGKRASGYIYT